mgnify:CR=1 FL=1
MKKLRSVLHLFLASFLLAGLLSSPAQSAPDCHAVGQREASRVGGQLARATPENRGGQQVCVIVVLMPAKDGQRPRRNEIVVPAR